MSHTGNDNAFNIPVVGISILILAIILLINHFFGFFGHYGFDDMYYAALAQQVVVHKFTFSTDHYNYRWIVIFLTAIAYRFMGINDTASAIMPVCFTLITAVLVAKSVQNKWQAGLAVILFGLYSWTLFYADKIMPDVYVAVFFFAAVYILYRQKSTNGNDLMYGMLFPLMLILGFLAKETILLTLPVFFYLFMADLLQKRNVKFWLVAIVAGIIILALYLMVIKIETGSFFQRFYAIRNGSYFNPCSYDMMPFSETIYRIKWALWLVFIRSGFFFLLIFSLAAISKRNIKEIVNVSSSDDLFAIVLILALLCSNFMTTSFAHYVPMCEDPRHYLFLVPVAAVVASKGVFLFFDNPKPLFPIPVLFFVTFWVAHHHQFENPYLTYLPLAFITSIALAASFAGLNLVTAGVLAVIAVCCAHPVQSFLYARQLGYKFQKQIIRRDILNRKEDVLVVTNLIEREYGKYYLGFDSSHVSFKSFDDIKHQNIPPHNKVFLLLDGFTNYMSGKSWNDLPEYAKKTSTYHMMDSLGCAELYEIKQMDLK